MGCRQPLTHATGGDLDFSVDRVINTGGYSAGNLASLSARVNRIKGSKSLTDVLECASEAQRSPSTDPDSLSFKEWVRLASIMVGPHSVATGAIIPVPQTTPLLPFLVADALQILQFHIFQGALGARGEPTLGRLRSLGGVSNTRRLHKLVQALRHKHGRNASALDVWLEPGVFPRFKDWAFQLSSDQVERALELVADGVAVTDTEIGRWSLITDGYAV